MRRRIVEVVSDEPGDWTAVLECHHRQRLHDQPPSGSDPDVGGDAEDLRRVGVAVDCPPCDRCELPDGLALLRTTAMWDETSIPAALRRDHRVAAATWGRLRVEAGALRFVASTDPPTDVVVLAGASQPIPPEVAHHVEVTGPVRCCVEFLGRSD